MLLQVTRTSLLAIVTAGLAVLAPACAGAQRSPSPPAAPRAPVVVTIVVDQLAAWVAAERWPELPRTGGFARLLREGTYVPEAHHQHACTDTAPGHATLYTGASPHDHGIFGNEVVDAASRGRVSILRDPASKLVTGEGAQAEPGSSLSRLRVETLSDRLRAEHPGAYIVSISLKDRGALFAAGRHPDAAVWWDPKRMAFVTSSSVGAELPAFARKEGSRAAVEAARTVWQPLDPAWVQAHAPTPDAAPGEGDWGGYGTTFPHDVTKAKSPGGVYRAHPDSDERILAMAREALADPRAGTVPTLLALSMSANDYVSHVFGPDSWESWDELYRLDAALGRFFGYLDSRFGERGWSAVLSADHGATSMPEAAASPAARRHCEKGAPNRYQRACTAGDRILLDELARALQAEATRVMGEGAWVLGVADPYVFLDSGAKALAPPARATLMKALVQFLSADPRVAKVLEVGPGPASCPGDEDESEAALLCRAIPAGAPGELYVSTKPGVFFDSDYVPGKGTSHGTPYVYDRAVPMVVRAPGRAEAGKVDDVPTSTASFSRTAAALLGIGAPASAKGGRSLVRLRRAGILGTAMSSEIDGIYDRAELVHRVASGLRPEYLFFWGHTGTGIGKWIFSQWYPAPFVVDAVRYATAEHWMMSEKARLFGDEDALARILADDDPSAAKAAGRAVRGYDDEAWRARRVGAVREGNVHKFRQNPEMGAYLLATRGRVLVEAAPRDTIWGIGLGAENPAARDPAKWRGQNLLGFALMWARAVLGASS